MNNKTMRKSAGGRAEANTKKNTKKVSGKSFTFEGRRRSDGQVVKGEVNARNEQEARDKLRKSGIQVLAVSAVKTKRLGKSIKAKDITVFARQLATMMKAGLPLLQAFEIVAKGHTNPAMTELLMTIRADIEQGTSLGEAFSKHPKYFDSLFCSLVAAGEAGGVLDSLLDKLATYMEKTEAIKRKVKGALMYPIIILTVAFALIVGMMMFVLPAFKQVYDGMGAELPALTQTVMDISDFFVAYGLYIIAAIVIGVIALKKYHTNSVPFQKKVDAWLLSAPIFGQIVKKSAIARWSRTTATLFTAGVPLVQALESVAGAAGNLVYEDATYKIRSQVEQGTSLTSGMQSSNMFPNMVLQMAAIGEESGSLDDMLNKAAEFYEDEVDMAVGMLSTMMEPIIMVMLGTIIGGLLVAMYLPLFSIGDVIG